MTNIDEKSIDELRVLANEMITNAKSGHPGIALGSAPILYSLFADVMAISPDDADNIFRDRFVMSAGHGSSLLYATLHAMGYHISKQDLMNFRKFGSKTPGHPEVDVTPGVDDSTGPLGQGVANAVGMAIAEKHFEAMFNQKDVKLFDGKVYCLVGDGCLMEGISYEALSLAGNLKLDNFVLIYDCNNITIEGKTDITFTDDIRLRFASIGFDVIDVKNGNSYKDISKALLRAKKAKAPTIVVVHTTIGFGTELAGNQKIHGTPLTEEMLDKLKINLFVNKPPFELSSEVKDNFDQKAKLAKQRLLERDKSKQYKAKYPKEYKEFRALFDEKFLDKAVDKIKRIKVDTTGTTRDINHLVMAEVANILPNFLGGSADVATSTKAFVQTDELCQKNYAGKLLHYGVREHAMAGISNGLALFGGILPYQSCFLSFVDYLKPALRMSALMSLRELLVLSHDSITAGEDGPTHQPIEQLPSLRLIPNTIVSRPYNLSEILATYTWLASYKKPVCMLVSKEKMQYADSDIEKAQKGGYCLKDCRKADCTIISTGADVARCLQASEILKQSGILCRVVSMPCVSVFEAQTKTYQKAVLKDLPKVFVEASAENCWYKFCGKDDMVIGVSSFGASGNANSVLQDKKMDAQNIAKQIANWHKSLCKTEEDCAPKQNESKKAKSSMPKDENLENVGKEQSNA